jgi:hypothetical protein
MKRIHPLLLIAACVVLLIGGVVWKSLSANKCLDEGGIVVAPMSKHQHCASQ